LHSDFHQPSALCPARFLVRSSSQLLKTYLICLHFNALLHCCQEVKFAKMIDLHVSLFIMLHNCKFPKNKTRAQNHFIIRFLEYTLIRNFPSLSIPVLISTDIWGSSIILNIIKTAIVTQRSLDNNASFSKLFSNPKFYQWDRDAMAQELDNALRKG